MERILVTGATGQIGSELTLELRRRCGNDNVIALGRKAKPSKALQESGPFEFLDVADRDAVEGVVRKYEITGVYHLAALLSATGEAKPQLAWQVNMDGLLNILEVARERGSMQVFYPSSIAVFGPETPA